MNYTSPLYTLTLSLFVTMGVFWRLERRVKLLEQRIDSLMADFRLITHK